MSSKTMFLVVEADNIAYDLSVQGPFPTHEVAYAVLLDGYQSNVDAVDKDEIDSAYLEGDLYKVLHKNENLYYGRIKEIEVEEPDTEAERWIKAVRDRADAMNIPLPENESDIAHIAEEAQHYAAKDEYFVGGFWNAIALAVQDYLDEKGEETDDKEDGT